MPNADEGKINKYYPKKALSFAQGETIKSVLDGKKLNKQEIAGLCSDFLTNRIYATIVENCEIFTEGKDEAFEVAAKVIIYHGAEIKEQLDKNDKFSEAALEVEGGNLKIPQTKPNTSKDVKKISGGSMAKIIAKITEMMAAMSPEEQAKFVGNVSAFFSVLNLSFDKIPQSMQDLAQKPVVIASIKDVLKGSEGGQIFDSFVELHLSDAQKKEVKNVSPQDLEEYKESAREQNKKSHSRAL